MIAVPTSVGYGASFHGLAALLGMLNSCASNVTVVNIDNGFGAGYAASLINRLAYGPRTPVRCRTHKRSALAGFSTEPRTRVSGRALRGKGRRGGRAYAEIRGPALQRYATACSFPSSAKR